MLVTTLEERDACAVADAAPAPAVAAECALVGGCGLLGAQDAVPGICVTETAAAVLDDACAEFECGSMTLSGCTGRPIWSERCGNSVYCGRCGMGATASGFFAGA